MLDKDKTQEELLDEIQQLRQELAIETGNQNVLSNSRQPEDKRYRLILEALSDFAFSITIDADNNLSADWIIGDYEKVTGYHVSEITDVRHFGVHPDDHASIDQSLRDIQQNKRSTSEHRFRHKNGHMIWLRVVRQPIWDEREGRVTRYYGATTNITQQKQDEDELKSSYFHLERQNRSLKLINNISDLLYRTLDFKSLIGSVLASIADYTGINTIAVYQIDESHQFLHIIGNIGYSEAMIQVTGTLPVDGSITGSAVQIRDIVIAPNAQQDSRSFPSSKGVIGAKGAIIVPLLYRDQVWGAMAMVVNSTYELPAIASDMLLTIGKTIGTVMANAEYVRQIEIESAERKKAEEQLRSQRNLLQTILDNIPDHIFVKDLDLRYILSNKAHAASIGMQPEDVLGKHIREIYSPDVVQDFDAQNLAIIDNGQPIINVESSRKVDGKVKWLLTSKVPLRNSDGKTIGLVGISRDISFRKNMEKTLEAERNLLRTLMDNIPDMIFVKDIHGQYLLSNQAHARYLGTTPDKVVGLTAGDFFPAQSASKFSVRELEIFASGKAILDLDSPRETESGTIWYSLSLIPFHDAEGATTGIVGISRNITERKEAEVTRLENETLQVALEKEQEIAELRNRFMSMVSHELRTPIATISLSTDILQRYWDRLSDERRQDKVETIHKQLRYLNRMLEDLGIGMRAERDFLDFNPGATDLGAICREIIDLYEEELSEKHTLRYKHSGHLNDLWLDATLMNHVLTNLVSNAVKYSPDGGEILLDVSRSDDEVVIAISDQGIGIPEEDQARLFGSFFRAGNVGDIRGTGLGLAIIKSIVELHGGTIICESAIDLGTTFRISIPIQAGGVNLR